MTARKKKLISIFGTFNPITNAHIQIARVAKAAIKADKVIYVPTKDSFLTNWKGMSDSAILASHQRLALMEEAVAPYGFEVEDVEVNTDISGKTYDTVAYLKKKYPDHQLYLLMGTDKVGELHRWYRGEELISENQFLIIDRDGVDLEDLIDSAEGVNQHKENFHPLDNEQFGSTSATEIRNAYIRHDLESVKDQIPANVYDYLSTHKGVYRAMDYGYRRVATASFEVRIGNVADNTKKILEIIKDSRQQDLDLLVFPELCITGYTCGDMFLRKKLADEAMAGLLTIARESKVTHKDDHTTPVIVVSLPMRNQGKLFNCAAFLYDGEVLGIAVKTYLPNYNEFYEKRWFASALDTNLTTIRIGEKDVPFGNDLVIETSSGMKIGCEICEDLWVTTPPSNRLVECGANIIVNPSASNEIVTKNLYRKDLVVGQSARLNCGYVYVSAGFGESTTDVVYSGHHLIAQTGSVMAEQKQLYATDPILTVGILDIEKIENDQVKMNSFRPVPDQQVRFVPVEVKQSSNPVLPTYMNAYPFIPADDALRKQRCEEILEIQATGLATRLRKTGIQKSVIGISGGLDSTLALLVVKEAYDLLGMDHKNIVAITMPGFGTTKQTKSSADRLMELVGADARTIDITKACKQHMKDIGQPADQYDVTYENIQARERTQILMDVANKENGLVIGTGDLSELALGWCTYNGDHMSMYAVNTSVPKTLVRFIIETYANEKSSPAMKKVLIDVCETVISPELLPPDAQGNIAQSTEQTIGKYDLHDFFLYHYVRNGFGKEKINQLAYIAFPRLPKQQIDDTLAIFIKRFVNNQFKRNCIPDGPKVGSVALSPRGDWRMPSDYQSN